MLQKCRCSNLAQKFLLYPLIIDVNLAAVSLSAKPFCDGAKQSRLRNDLYDREPNYTLTCIEYIQSHSII
jgi:hypothetical protein